jgi:hypothetical protein
MRNMKITPLPQPTLQPIAIPAVEQDEAELDDGFDPYQEYYNFLVDTGMESAAAWEQIWANPARAMDIGWKLADMPPAAKMMAFAA